MKYQVIVFLVLASFRSDDGEVAHIKETGHGCHHEFHRHVMLKIERLLEG